MLNEEDTKKIMEIINDRIKVGLSVHTKTILQSAREYTLDVMEQRTDKIMTEIKETAEDIFKNMEFLDKFKKSINNDIERMITFKLNEQGLSEHIRVTAKSVTKDVFKDIIKDVVHEVVISINKKLNYELNISKQLCYSIDAEIRHTLMKNPTSPNTDEMIKKKINESVDKMTANIMNKQIENKVV